MLTVKSEKMSKSLGNIVSLKEAFSRWKPEVVRLWLATVHYRSVVDFSEEALHQAERNYERLSAAAKTLRDLLRKEEFSFKLSESGRSLLNRMDELRREFFAAMDDDFNASRAFSQVYELTTLVFTNIAQKPESAVVIRAYALMEEFNRVLGVLDSVFAGGPPLPFEQLVELVVEVRRKLRVSKNYELADWIRAEMAKLGIKLYDRGEETTWQLA
jgi:cysteinyl-tRNA synthetase